MSNRAEPSEQLIRRDTKREFFVTYPAFIDYLGLTPLEFRLYQHYLRVCGDHNECYESAETTADFCSMSAGAVSQGRRALAENGLIHLEARGHKNHQRMHITVRTLWELNSNFLQTLRRQKGWPLADIRTWLKAELSRPEEMEEVVQDFQPSPGEGKNAPLPSQPSPHEGQASLYEGQASPGEGQPSLSETQASLYEGQASPGEAIQDHYIQDPLNHDPTTQDPVSQNGGGGASTPPLTLHPLKKNARARAFRVAMRSAATDLIQTTTRGGEWRGSRTYVERLDEPSLDKLLAWLWVHKLVNEQYSDIHEWEDVQKLYGKLFAGLDNPIGYIIKAVDSGQQPELDAYDVEQLQQYVSGYLGEVSAAQVGATS